MTCSSNLPYDKIIQIFVTQNLFKMILIITFTDKLENISETKLCIDYYIKSFLLEVISSLIFKIV